MNQHKLKKLNNSYNHISYKGTDMGKTGSIYLTARAYFKMMFYTQLVSTEIGGILLVRRQGRRRIIEDAILLKQNVTSGTVNLSTDAIRQFMIDNPKLVPRMGGWWHSHVTMGTSWSDTDDETTLELARIAGSSVAIVTTTQGNNFHMQVASSRGKAIRNIDSIQYEHIDMHDILKLCQNDIKKRVKERIFFYRPFDRAFNRQIIEDKYDWFEEEEHEQPRKLQYTVWDF